MFAGVGSFSIIIARYSRVEKVYSIDVNPIAFEYMRENVLLNHVVNRVIPLEGDARTVLTERLQNTADRVLMPLPDKSYEYLDYAVMALKQKAGWIHYYGFEHARKGENPVEKVKMKISRKLSRMGVDFAVSFGRTVRDTGPRWQQVVVDVEIHGKT
jgi:tRNA (guanine37-N1)-methyltransferase